jgi:hypothetical protein
MYFSMSSNIIFNAFNPSRFWCILLFEKKKIFMFNIRPLVFPMCLFNNPIIICWCYFVVILLAFFFFFFSFFFWSFVVLFKCVYFVDKT